MKTLQDIKDRLSQHADAIDRLASSLRTVGHDVNISILEHRADRGFDYCDVAEKLVFDLTQQIKLMRVAVGQYHEKLRQ